MRNKRIIISCTGSETIMDLSHVENIIYIPYKIPMNSEEETDTGIYLYFNSGRLIRLFPNSTHEQEKENAISEFKSLAKFVTGECNIFTRLFKRTYKTINPWIDFTDIDSTLSVTSFATLMDAFKNYIMPVPEE